MKEKIIAILKDSYRSLTYKDPDTGDIKSTTALMITSEQFPRIADKIEHLINAEMPTEVTDDEIAAMALEFAPVCIYGNDDDREDVNGSIREDVTKLLKQLRNRMSKPKTGGEKK